MAKNTRALAFGAALSAGFLLAGCGGFDDVQLNGTIFNAMGLNQAKKTGDPKVAQRAPLVLPPNLERLPEPGKQPGSETTDLAALKDPDEQKKVSKAELQKQQDAYCKVNYEQAKARGDDNADLAQGPLGPCKASVFNMIKGFGKADADDDAQ